jgi:hypothetical protein
MNFYLPVLKHWAMEKKGQWKRKGNGEGRALEKEGHWRRNWVPELLTNDILYK